MLDAEQQFKLFTINETCRLLSIGRSTVHVLIRKGALDPVSVLGATRITAESIERVVTGGYRKRDLAANDPENVKKRGRSKPTKRPNKPTGTKRAA
jgi:hypothetical protein